MSSRDFEMKGQLTLTFKSYEVALVAHTLLYGAFQAIGRYAGGGWRITKPDPNLDPDQEPAIPRGPFVITISGQS